MKILYPFPSVLLFAWVTTSLHAGTPNLPPVPADDGGTPRFVLDINSHYEFSESSPAGPGGDIFKSGLSIPFFVPLSGNWKLFGALRGGYTDYETNPFDARGLQTWNVGGLLAVNGRITDTWSATFGVLGGASWEEDASFSDSLNGGVLALAEYRFSPTLKAGLGALYLTRQNDDPLVVPVLGLDWEVSEQFRITLEGLNLRAEYKVNPAWAAYVRGEFDPGGALLKKRAGIEADSFDDRAFLAAAGLKWSPTRTFSVSLEGGVAFRDYTLFNDSEEILSEDRLDPAPFIGVSARLSF